MLIYVLLITNVCTGAPFSKINAAEEDAIMMTLIRYINDQRGADDALLNIVNQRQSASSMVFCTIFYQCFTQFQDLIRQLRSINHDVRHLSRQPLRFGK
jgi:hypothetical protein